MRKFTCFALTGCLLVGSATNSLAYNSDDLTIQLINAPVQPTFYEEVVLHKLRVYPEEIKSESEELKINVTIPVIEGLKDSTYQQKINETIKKQAMKDIEEAKKESKQFAEDCKENGWEIRANEIYIDYDVIINGEENQMVSIKVTSYFNNGGTGNPQVDFYNFINNETASDIQLEDLFGENYKQIINKEIKAQIKEDQDQYFEENGFESITEDQGFYINGREVIIAFDKYEIAPGYMGTPEFKIPIQYDRIMINGTELNLGSAGLYRSDSGEVMIPLRIVSEALGYKVEWNAELHAIEVTKGAQWIMVKIGEDYYSFGKMAPISLGTAAEVTDGTTYVPMSYVTNILKAKISYHPSGEIRISQEQQNKEINPLSMNGNIIDIQSTDKTTQLWIKGIMPGGYEDTIILNISEETQLVDPITNKKLTIDDFSLDDTVRAFFGPAMTSSLPPQATAEKIEILKDVAVSTGIITDIREGEKWNQIAIGGMDGIVLTLSDETEIVTEDNKKLKFQDLEEGMEIDGFHHQIMTMSIPPMSTAIKIVVKEGNAKEQEKKLNYKVTNNVYRNEDKDIKIFYPQISGFPGELSMDYMNQSLSKIKEIYSDEARYSDVKINYKITRKDNDVLSVLFEGTAKMKDVGEINIQQSINLDMKTSNEITYDNLVKDEEKVKQLLDEKAREKGIEEGMVAEGMRVFFDKKEIVFYYMPLDDSAKDFIELSIPMDELKNYINKDFGEHPAS